MSQIVDLSQPIYEGMPHHPVHFAPELTRYAELDVKGWRATRLVLPSHIGTHLDAPFHYIEHGKTVDQIPLDVFWGMAQIVHFSGLEPRQEILSADLPPITQARVLLHTGWGVHADEANYIVDQPYLGADAAKTLVNQGVRLVGIDCPSVDFEPSETHHVLLGSDAVIVENVMNLAQLGSEAMVVILPLPVQGIDGCPVRALAMA